MILRLFADKSQVSDLDTSGFIEFGPTSTGYAIRILGLVLGAHLYDRQVWHVRPLFFVSHGIHIQAVVQLAHSVSSMCDADKYSRRYRNKGFHFPERNLERL